ncbi:MAG: hypothetical protein WAO02_11995 [Verrucomicrobiia bacterium]
MRRIIWTLFGLWLCSVFIAAGADTFPLTDGTSMTGDVISYNDNGVVFRLDVDKYSERVPWTKFSQDALKQLSSVNPKIKLLAEPFIESPPAERAKKSEATVHEVSRLDLPPRSSLFGALFSSSVGLIALMLIYAANLYAAYEIAVCRARPLAMVMGVSVVLPILGPIIFLAMPVPVAAPEPVAQEAAAASQTFAVPGSAAPAAAGIHIVEASWQGKTAAAPDAGANEPQVFQRGQFTFNRRFFETKFSAFFALIRREADKNLVLTVKTGRANMVVERITRIATNEMHVEITAGAGKQEVMVPFAEVVEVQLKTKGA